MSFHVLNSLKIYKIFNHENHNFNNLRFDQLKELRKNYAMGNIVELVPIKNLFFVIFENGTLIASFTNNIHKYQRLNLPIQLDVVKSIIQNKHAHQIIIISTCKESNQSAKTIRVRAVKISEVLFLLTSNQEDNINAQSIELFKDEDLSQPGFVEYEDSLQQLVTKSGFNGNIKVWDLNGYQQKVSIFIENVWDVRLTNNFIMIIVKNDNIIQLFIYSISNAVMVRKINIEIPDSKIEMLELIDSDVLFKQIEQSSVIIQTKTQNIYSSNNPNESLTGQIQIPRMNRFILVSENKQIKIYDNSFNIDSEIKLDMIMNQNIFVDKNNYQLFLLAKNQKLNYYNHVSYLNVYRMDGLVLIKTFKYDQIKDIRIVKQEEYDCKLQLVLNSSRIVIMSLFD